MTKHIVALLMLVSSGLYSSSARDRRFDEWIEKKDAMVYYGIEANVTQKDVLRLLKEAVQTRLDEIKDIDAGINTVSSKSFNYVMIAETYGTAYRELTEYSRYSSAIFNEEKEKQIDEEWSTRYHSWKWKFEEKRLQKFEPQSKEEFLKLYPQSTGRIKGTYADEWIKEFSKKAAPFVYLLKQEEEYWKLSREYGKDADSIDLADFALNSIKNGYYTMLSTK